jgi:hypothetical protein
MARTARWNEIHIVNGVLFTEIISWKYFHDYIRQEFLDLPNFVWRGQRDAAWSLVSSLDRLLTPYSGKTKQQVASRHLGRFQLASRGRRGPNPARINDENEWWAIAQHNGMATPLLDWTESPFVALYFAFEKDAAPPSGKRAVWALGGITDKNEAIRSAHTGSDPPPTLDIVRPLQDDNSRLVSQSGLFTRVPIGTTVDNWISANFADEATAARLVKISMPNTDRSECLRTLNRMNINHLSLFPDLFGAGKHCNNALQISRY